MKFILRHKKKGITIEQSIANINRILSQFRELITLCDDDNFVSRLKSLEDKIEYTNPSTDDNIAYLDTKISNQLGDLKLQLISRQPKKHIDYKLETILLMITERNAKV